MINIERNQSIEHVTPDFKCEIMILKIELGISDDVACHYLYLELIDQINFIENIMK